MKKRIRFILIGVVLIVIAVGGWIFFHRAPAVAVVMDTVKRGNLTQTVEVTGDVKTIQNIDLAFDASGVIGMLSAYVGDAVTAGESLARLDAGDASAAALAAENTARRAQAELDLKRAGASREEIAVSQADVAVASAGLVAAQSDEARVNAVQDAAVAAAEEQLAQTRTNTADTAVQSRDNVVDAVRALLSQTRHALSDADTVLGVENKLFNQTFRDVLGNENAQTVSDATAAFEKAAASRDRAEDALLALDVKNDAAVDAAAILAQTAYQNAYAALLQTNRVLDATSANSIELSLQDLKTDKSTMTTAIGTLVADGSALTKATQAFASARVAVTHDVTTAQNALASAVATRDREKASAVSEAASRAADLTRTQAALANLTAAPREVDLASLRAAAGAAEADASGAAARLKKSEIVSPIDGVVTAVNVDKGESATAGVTAITILSSGQNFEITMDIPEADVAKIQTNDPANVTFDAFGDSLVFHGTVTKIDPAQKVIQGVVFYEATVILATDQDISAVKPGMTANVTIQTADRSNVLSVPSRAVLEKNGVKYVRVVSSGATVERPVDVGLRANGGQVEITSGLSEGETIIVSSH